jgi:hypothetical protein
MATQNRKRNVQQHFVTASYLAGFTPDGNRNSQLYIYERNGERIFRAIPDEVAKRRNYYSIPMKSGEFDDRVDVMITALEGQAMPSLKKLIARDYQLVVFERALLAHLIAFQEFRTPWARENFQKIQLRITEQQMKVAANAPGYFERLFEQLKAEGKLEASATPDGVRDALRNDRIRLKANPHAGIDTMVSTAQAIGNIYVQMRWVVLHSKGQDFLTSDTPVIRRNPGYSGGVYGGGLFAPAAEVWFPLSKRACLLICHDREMKKQFWELVEAGKMIEANALGDQLPPIVGSEVSGPLVSALNSETILNADRFIYSPFASEQVQKQFKGESNNVRVTIS